MNLEITEKKNHKAAKAWGYLVISCENVHRMEVSITG